MHRHPLRARRTGLMVVSVAASALLLAACGGSIEPAAEKNESWQPKKNIEWIVPYSPGGGFDIYSRGLAEVMQAEFLPDGVNIVIRNSTPLPAGITQMFNASPDGYTVGILPMPASVAQQIQDPTLAKWKTEEFTVLGQVDENAYVVYVPADSPYQSIEDLIEAKNLRTITVEQGSSSALAGLATIEALGLDAKVTYGAEGSSEVVTAALRGDADFFVYGTTDVVGFVDSGDVRPLLFLGTEEQRGDGLEWLADTPSAGDAGFPDLAGVVTELRIIVAPPDLPEDVAEYLRKTLADTMASQAFADWAVKAERPIVPRDADAAKANVDAQIEQMQVLVPGLAQ